MQRILGLPKNEITTPMKRLKILRVIPLLLLNWDCSTINLYAQNFIEVNDVKGIGLSAVDAENDALINAVRQALGAFVDSKTLIVNDELVEEKIIVSSGGFIDEHMVLSKSLLGSGIFQVVINARVSRNKLETRFSQQKLSKSLDISNEYAKSWSKLTERKAAGNAANLLLQSIVLSQEPTITHRYDEVEECLKLDLRWVRKPDEWVSILASAKQVLASVSTGSPVKVTTPMLRLNEEFAMQRYAHLSNADSSRGNLLSRPKGSPSFFLATNIAPLLRHPVQQQAEHAWILWIQQSTSSKETRWVGYVMETDLFAIQSLLATHPVIAINLEDNQGQTLIKQSMRARFQLNEKGGSVVPIETGLFALSSEGQRFIADSDSRGTSSTSNALPLEKFWRENQTTNASKINVFVLKNPVVYSIAKVSDEDSILDRRFLPGREKETFATFALLHCPNLETNNKEAIAGLNIGLDMPLKLRNMRELKKLYPELRSTFEEQQDIIRMQECFENDCKIHWESDGLTYGLKLSVNDSTRTLLPPENLLNLKDLEIACVPGRELETLKLFSRNTKIEKLRINFQPMDPRHALDTGCADIIASQTDLQELQISGCSLDSEAASFFTELKSLATLDLRHSFVGDYSLSVLSRIRSLTDLKLEDVESEQQVSILAKMPSLRRLTVQTLPSDDIKSLLMASLPECQMHIGSDTSEASPSN